MKINRILNYWYDLERASMVSFDPELIKYFLETPSYASVGHSAHIQYSTAINCLSSIVDKDSFSSKADKWGPEFQKLQKERLCGTIRSRKVFHYRLSEQKEFSKDKQGCCSFSTYFSSNGKYSFENFRQKGY